MWRLQLLIGAVPESAVVRNLGSHLDTANSSRIVAGYTALYQEQASLQDRDGRKDLHVCARVGQVQHIVNFAVVIALLVIL